MLRHDERRVRLVVADARRRELRLAVGAGAVAERALALRARRRLRDCQRDDGTGEQRARRSSLVTPCRGLYSCTSADVAGYLRREVSQPAGKPNSVRLRSTRALRRAAATAATTIPLGPRLLAGSSDLPGGFGRAVRRRAAASGRATRHPIWSCSVRGFACHRRYRRRGALLPHLFTLTPRLARLAALLAQGGIFSVPLSVRLPCPGVTRRTALRSSDFPPAFALRAPASEPSPARVRKPAVVWLTATIDYRRTTGGRTSPV